MNIFTCYVLITVSFMPTACFSWSDVCSIKRNYMVSSKLGYDAPNCTNFTSGVPCATLEYLFNHVHYNCSTIYISDLDLLNSVEIPSHSFELSFVGNGSNPTIYCKGNGGLYITISHKIHMENLNFIGCSLNLNQYFNPGITNANFSSLTFHQTEDVEVIGCSFTNNMGSALMFIDGSGKNVIKNSVFLGSEYLVNLTESRRGGIVITQTPGLSSKSSYNLINCTFMKNINLPSNTVCSADASNSIVGHFGYGGAIDVVLFAKRNNTDFLIANCTFINNSAFNGGAISFTFGGQDSTYPIRIASSIFVFNSACHEGGAILFISSDQENTVHQVDNVTIEVLMNNCSFVGNRAYWAGGISIYVCTRCGSTVTFSAIASMWIRNNAWTSGFAIGIESQSAIKANFYECNFSMNTNRDYYDNINGIGALSVSNGNITLNNTLFELNYGTALLLKESSIATFVGNIHFLQNFGIKGGAILLREASYLNVLSMSNIQFNSNEAIMMGGAVYSTPIEEKYESGYLIPCAFTFPDGFSSFSTNITFVGNMASNSDQSLFIGNLNGCIIPILERFNYIPFIGNQLLTVPSKIEFTTVPEMINNTLEVMLGEIFYLHPIVTDFFHHNSTFSGSLALLPANREKNEEYSHVSFTLRGPNTISIDNYTKNMEFYIEGPDKMLNSSQLVIEFFYEEVSSYRLTNSKVNVALIPCKLGYSYSHEKKKCVCVTADNVVCSSDDTPMVCIKKGYWYDDTIQKSIPCPYRKCGYSNGNCPKSSENCPKLVGYCRINTTNDLCRMGRGKILCSQCQANYSFTFGAYQCVPSDTCSRINTALLMLGVSFYWIFFIVFLLTIVSLNLSMGSGFMYGIVYFFSVSILFTEGVVTDKFLRVLLSICISMTQLDPQLFGEIGVCFVQNWDNDLPHLMFRYITPVFVFSTILTIIYLCRYCRPPKNISLAENSPIHAMCLLVLFSYTSISYTNFQILQSININGKLYVNAAPNIPYFDPKDHLPYALFAIVVEVFISLPICLLLLFAPYLSKHINIVKIRVKPILDDFQACYRPECRWFAGFYFLARQLIYLMDTIFHEDLPQSNTILQYLTIAVLIVHTSFQPYKKTWHNLWDTFLIVDLLLLSMYSISAPNHLQYLHLNQYLHKVTPYVLLLIPSCYLFGVIAVLLFKKICVWVKECRCCRACVGSYQSDGHNPQYLAKEPTSTTVGFDSDTDEDVSAKHAINGSFFTDPGEREPLLSEIEHGPKDYRSISVYPQTSSSFRVSSLHHFPPNFGKASTK